MVFRMIAVGNIRKMKSEIGKNDGTVNYLLPVGTLDISMNELIGQEISLEYKGQINCIHCGRETRKSFSQGYCYPCFISLPQTDECIIHPEKCRAHEGISRDMEWAEQNCLQEHIVYLALTPGLKVGVTRLKQVPTRWIDQGAWEAIRLAMTPNRHTAGIIEVHLKEYLSDKTNWRQMLNGTRFEGIDLITEKEKIMESLDSSMTGYITDDNEIVYLDYPVLEYPEKVTSLNLEANPIVSGTLSGIKGQYLIFEEGSVINIRKFGGYLVEFKTNE